jgi:hypothetical protein
MKKQPDVHAAGGQGGIVASLFAGLADRTSPFEALVFYSRLIPNVSIYYLEYRGFPPALDLWLKAGTVHLYRIYAGGFSNKQDKGIYHKQATCYR